VRIPRLHVVTDDDVIARPDFADRAVEVLQAASDAIALHVRGPRTDGSALYRLVITIRNALGDTAAGLVVNDRVDVALAAGLRGVHLGERSLSAVQARTILPGPARIGCSVHDEESALEAGAHGADYVFVGAVYPTRSHPGVPGFGTDVAADIGRRAGVPWIGIGGMTPDRCQEVVQAGGHGVAVLGGIWQAEDPIRAVQRYVSALDDTGRARSDP